MKTTFPDSKFPVAVTFALLLLSGALGFAQPGTRWTRLDSLAGKSLSVNGCALAPDSSLVFVGTSSSGVLSTYDGEVWRVSSAGAILSRRTLRSDSEDAANCVAVQGDGSYVVAGYTNANAGNYHSVWFTGFSANGDSLWSRTWYGDTQSGEIYAIAATADGGFVAAGDVTSPNNTDLYLVRMNGDGDTLWTRAFGGYGHQQEARFCAHTSDGGFLLAGTGPEYSFYSDFFVVRTDSNGDTLWTQTIGQDTVYELCYGGCLTPDGGCVLVGARGSSPQRDCYVVKLSSSGELEWERIFGSASEEDESYSIVETPDGGYVIGGAGGVGGQVYKITAQGDSVWRKTIDLSEFGWESVRSVVRSPCDDYVLGGFVGGSALFQSIGPDHPSTYVTGTWTAANSPYYLYGNHEIAAGESLIIEPGVDVIFTTPSSLIVRGNLQAEGTIADSIRFYSGPVSWPCDTFTTWRGIQFLGSQAGASRLSYCAIEGARNDSGAGVLISGGNPVFSSCAFRGNSARYKGGGAMVYSGSPQFDGCEFCGNSALTYPGTGGGLAIRAAGGIPQLNRCSFFGNSAISGGGVYVGSGFDPVSIDSCLFDSNSASGGGGLFASGGQVSLSYCVMTRNVASFCEPFPGFNSCGNAISVFGTGLANVSLFRCTLMDNVSDHSGALSCGSSSGFAELEIVSSIIYNAAGSNIKIGNNGLLIMRYSDVYLTPVVNSGGSAPAGLLYPGLYNPNGDPCDSFYNITLDPLFLRDWFGDTRLTNCSPCIDAGDSSIETGQPLLDPDSTRRDMGYSHFSHSAEVATDPSDFCPATVIPYYPFCYRNGSTDGVMNDFSTCGENTAPDLIYSFTPDTSGTYNVSLCGSEFDCLLEVRTGGGCPGAFQVACNDDNPSCGRSARLAVPMNGGQEYWIILDGSGGASGIFDFSLNADTTGDLGSFSGAYEDEPCPAENEHINNGCVWSNGQLEFQVSPLSENTLGTINAFDYDYYLVDPVPVASNLYLTYSSTVPIYVTVISLGPDTGTYCDSSHSLPFGFFPADPYVEYQRTYFLNPGIFHAVVVRGILAWLPPFYPERFGECGEYHLRRQVIDLGGLDPCPADPEPGDIEESINPEPYPPDSNFAQIDPNGGCVDSIIQATVITPASFGHYLRGSIFSYYDSSAQAVVSDQDWFEFSLSDTTDITWSARLAEGGLIGAVYDQICSPPAPVDSASFVCYLETGVLQDTRARLLPGTWYLRLARAVSPAPEGPFVYRAILNTQPYQENDCPHDYEVLLDDAEYTHTSTTCGAADKSSVRPGADRVYRLVTAQRREYQFSLCGSTPGWNTYLFLTGDCSSDTLIWNDNGCGSLSEIACARLELGVHYLIIEPDSADKCDPYVLTITLCSNGMPCAPDTITDLIIRRIADGTDEIADDILLRWSGSEDFTGVYVVYRADGDSEYPAGWTVLAEVAPQVPSGVNSFVDADVIASSRRTAYYLVIGRCP